MNDDDDDDYKEDGSVWTSYSDMFTTMAIIFLVLFVFALLRSGVSTLTAIKEKKEKEAFIQGSISKKNKNENNKILVNMQNEINDMQEFSKVIDDKMKKINKFAKKMKKHKTLVAKSLNKQTLAQVALNSTQKNLTKKNEIVDRQSKELKKLNTHIESFHKEITRLKREKIDLIKAKSKVAHKVSELRKENKTQLVTVKNTEKSVKEIKKSFERKEKENGQLQNVNSSLTLKIKEKDQSIETFSKKINNRDIELSKISKKMKYVQNYTENLKNEIEIKSKSIQDLKGRLSTLKMESNKYRNEVNQSNSEIQKLESGIKGLHSKNNSQENQIENMKNSSGSMAKKLSQARSNLADAQEKNRRISRGIASVRNNIRSKIGQNIALKLQNENLKVKVDPATGSVTLKMDDEFQFKRNDFKLSTKAKNTLKRIIPLYVEAIFNDPKTYKYIECVNIIGHASPRYKKEFVSPNRLENEEAYIYNMELSTNRAKEIVKYIFSKDFGQFNNKSKFRQKISAIGRSFSDPISRAPSSTSHDDCGKFDCTSSRRVEIRFTLKEDRRIWDKVENIN
ncbi:hypothetical protein A9Q84_16020 [Halobacteriovorax marinus]|uniref:Uncharacterized protein n=1 Tax=Halobacteriovorax marinus TaxID=97084 RepID=A0A1Y5F439_9BACT|nr:hypothetical protein A9Q84_16020 [Halobacteriovorax marinus]